jgi:hypothetical protein
VMFSRDGSRISAYPLAYPRHAVEIKSQCSLTRLSAPNFDQNLTTASCPQERAFADMKEGLRLQAFPDGASQIRTGDLLGAIAGGVRNGGKKNAWLSQVPALAPPPISPAFPSSTHHGLTTRSRPAVFGVKQRRRVDMPRSSCPVRATLLKTC